MRHDHHIASCRLGPGDPRPAADPCGGGHHVPGTPAPTSHRPTRPTPDDHRPSRVLAAPPAPREGVGSRAHCLRVLPRHCAAAARLLPRGHPTRRRGSGAPRDYSLERDARGGHGACRDGTAQGNVNAQLVDVVGLATGSPTVVHDDQLGCSSARSTSIDSAEHLDRRLLPVGSNRPIRSPTIPRRSDRGEPIFH